MDGAAIDGLGGLHALYERVLESDPDARAVEIVDTDYGKGLVATRDIDPGATCVWYGGVFLPIRGHWKPSRTHSLFTADRTEPSVERVVPSVIDGTVLKQVAQQTEQALTDETKARVAFLSGAMMNSSRDTGERPNVRKSDTDAVFVFHAGCRYAAQRFEAARKIARGEELRWDYKVVCE